MYFGTSVEVITILKNFPEAINVIDIGRAGAATKKLDGGGIHIPKHSNVLLTQFNCNSQHLIRNLSRVHWSDLDCIRDDLGQALNSLPASGLCCAIVRFH